MCFFKYSFCLIILYGFSVFTLFFMVIIFLCVYLFFHVLFCTFKLRQYIYSLIILYIRIEIFQRFSRMDIEWFFGVFVKGYTSGSDKKGCEKMHHKLMKESWGNKLTKFVRQIMCKVSLILKFVFLNRLFLVYFF